MGQHQPGQGCRYVGRRGRSLIGSTPGDRQGAQDDRLRWNRRYAASETGRSTSRPRPPDALTEVARWLPSEGVAVDLAGGTGGAALELARRGLRPVLVEVSDIAIEIAEQAAADEAVELSTVRLDLVGAQLASVLDEIDVVGLDEPVRVVTCFHFLDRVLLASVADGLPDNAVFAAGIATTTNLERNERPSARFLLEPGELGELVAGDSNLAILHSSERWRTNGHHEAAIVVRRH